MPCVRTPEERRPRLTDPFELLRVGYDADTGQIRTAYLDQARRLHPDAGGDAHEFVTLQDSYKRANAIRRGQHRQPHEQTARPTSESTAAEPPSSPSPAQSKNKRLTDLGAWIRPWTLVALVTQVIALCAVALGQPDQPGFAVAAALVLGPLAGVAARIAGELSEPFKENLQRLTHHRRTPSR